MEFFIIITLILCFILMLVLYFVFMYVVNRKQKELIDSYEKLLILESWCENITEEANRLPIIDRIEKRGYELINQLDKLNANIAEIQEHHVKLQEQQKNLHHSLLEEHKLLNEYFQNYS